MGNPFVCIQDDSVPVAALVQEHQEFSSPSISCILQSGLKEQILNADKEYSAFLKGEI